MDYFNSPEFTDFVYELLKEAHNPGLAIAIVQDGNIASRGYGNACVDPEKPVTADTLFDIASSSKSLTAASVALLVADDDKPQVQWQTTMCDLLPDDFVMPVESYTQDITVEDILSHRTGLPGHDASYLGIKAEKPDDARSVTRNLRNLPVSQPIRTKYMYANMMYTVATHLVEQLSNCSFSDFLHQHFFAPLKMDSTYLQPSAAIAAGLEDRIATSYFWNYTGTYAKVEWQETPEAQGAGSIFTSVNDYIKWVRALMHREAPVTGEVQLGLTKPRTIQNGANEEDPHSSPILYGAGLETYHYRGHKVVGHNGLVAGFGSRHFFLPELKFGAVILGNSSMAGVLADIIAQEFIDEVVETPPGQRQTWKDMKIRLEKESDTQSGKEKPKEDAASPQPLTIPLSMYTGQYWNDGYHGMEVEIREEKLFIDATDRSFPMILEFKHLKDGTKFEVLLSDTLEGGWEFLNAEFEFAGSEVVRMGLRLEEELEDMIWFHKIDS